MKRLLLATTLFAAAATLSAQQKVVTVYSMTRQQQEQYTNANVNGISANGQYAVGSAVELSTDAFIWNRATGQFQQITGSFNNSATAYAVSNEGKVVGTFYSDNNGEVPEDGTAYVIPGVWEDGVWTALELELPMQRGEYNGEARTISPDGRIVTGYILGHYQVKDAEGFVVKEQQKLRPAVWIDGELQPAENLPDGELTGQGMWAFSASDDAKVLGGVYEHPTGSRAPAVWVEGETAPRLLYGQKDIDIDKDKYFFQGQVYSVSGNGKWACGYFSPSGGTVSDLKSFRHNVETNETEEFASIPMASCVTNDGTTFGTNKDNNAALIHTANFDGTFANYLAQISGTTAPDNLPTVVQAATADLSVIGGWYGRPSKMGEVMAPSIVVISNVADGITATETAQPFSLKAGVCNAPLAARLQVFDTAGRLLRQNEGTSIQLSGISGTVIVKAILPNGDTISRSFSL